MSASNRIPRSLGFKNLSSQAVMSHLQGFISHPHTHILLLKVRFIRGHFHRHCRPGRSSSPVHILHASCEISFHFAFHPSSFAHPRYSKFSTKTTTLKPRPASFYEIQLCGKIDQKWSEERRCSVRGQSGVKSIRELKCIYETPEEVFKF